MSDDNSEIDRQTANGISMLARAKQIAAALGEERNHVRLAIGQTTGFARLILRPEDITVENDQWVRLQQSGSDEIEFIRADQISHVRIYTIKTVAEQ